MKEDFKTSTFAGLLLRGLILWALTGCTSAAAPPPPSETTGATKSVDIDESSGDDDDDEDDGDLSEEDEDEDEDSSDDEDADDEEGEEEQTDPYAALLHADKLKECHDDGKVYDRRTAGEGDEGECHEAKWPAEFSCTKAGVISAFKSSQSIKDYVAKQEDDGYKIDQCGEYSSGDPIVFYTKKSGTDTDPELGVRVVEPQ